MKRRDRSALKRAIEIMRAEDQKCRDQVDDMLKDKNRTWLDVGDFCAMHCQMVSLGCKPWQLPPVLISDVKAALREPPDDPHQAHGAALLLKQMLDAGVSRYDPDPLNALAQAKAARTGTAA